MVYIFWECTSELSVLNLRRHTLRSLKSLTCSLSDTNQLLSASRVHSGLVWVDEMLYVFGGFSKFVGDDRRPTAPRDDMHCYDPNTDTWYVIFLIYKVHVN